MQAYATIPTCSMHVLAGGRTIEQSRLRLRWSDAEVQAAFDAARAQYGHALCACRAQPLKLQIRRREGRYHLAVWPEEGALHDSECAFFRDELAEEARLSGEPPAEAAAPPTQPAAPATEPDRHRVSFTLSHAASGHGSKQITIKALMLRLWERASLCRWHPSWTRDWGRARYELLRSAADLEINGTAAEQLLWMPRPYRPSAQEALNREWEMFVRGLMTARGSTRILIAPVRRFLGASQGRPAALHFRHLMQPIGLSQACHEFIVRDCRGAIRALTLRAKASDFGQPEVVGAFIVEGSSRGGVWARAGWMLPVHPACYVPAPNTNTVLLVQALIEQGYAFQYLPTDTPPTRRTGPDWLVRHVIDAQGRPIARAALEILDPGSSPGYVQVRIAIANRMAAAGVPTWTWLPTGPREQRKVPPLPPHDRLSPSDAKERLAQLHRAPSVQYRYGVPAAIHHPSPVAEPA
jgi:hypothetical protein